MSIKLFVTGTDTGVGKTYVSSGLLQAFNQLNLSTIGIKPIASGGVEIENILYNEDALSLQQHASIPLDYAAVNPFFLSKPVAPYLTGHVNNLQLNTTLLNQTLTTTLNHPADICLIEGAGGWYVPLNQTETIADWVRSQKWNVILVVGIRLGCLNHGIMTVKALQQDGVRIIGWIANCLDAEMECRLENINTLKQWLPIPCLGVVDHQGTVAEAVDAKEILSLIKMDQDIIQPLS